MLTRILRIIKIIFVFLFLGTLGFAFFGSPDMNTGIGLIISIPMYVLGFFVFSAFEKISFGLTANRNSSNEQSIADNKQEQTSKKEALIGIVTLIVIIVICIGVFQLVCLC